MLDNPHTCDKCRPSYGLRELENKRVTKRVMNCYVSSHYSLVHPLAVEFPLAEPRRLYKEACLTESFRVEAQYYGHLDHVMEASHLEYHL